MTQRRMRIGFVGNVPPPIGGAEVLLHQFLKHFLVKRHRSAVLLRWRKQVFLYFPERMVRVYAPRGTVTRRGNLQVHYVFEALQRQPHERYSAYDERVNTHYTRQAGHAAEIFKQTRVDLIHAHMLFPNLLFGAIAAQAVSVPLVLSIHGMLEFRLLDHYRTEYPRFATRVLECLSRADTVLAASDEIAKECRKRGAKHVVKISGGLDTQVFRPPADQSLGRDILFLGSVRQDKGASLLIQAFERMNGAIEGNLVFVGRPLLSGPVVERARRNRRIRFLGEQDAPGVRRALKRARMVVLPSQSEGLPISILEAMAYEKPVLVTAAGDLSHVIHHGRNGFLLETRGPAALARGIQAVAAREDLKEIGRAARRTAQLFDIRVVVDRHEALYRSLLR